MKKTTLLFLFIVGLTHLNAQSKIGKFSLVSIDSFSFEGAWSEGKGNNEFLSTIQDGKSNPLIITDENYREMYETIRDTIDFWFNGHMVISNRRKASVYRVADLKKGTSTNYSLEKGGYKVAAEFIIEETFKHNPFDLKNKKVDDNHSIQYTFMKGQRIHKAKVLFDSSIQYPSRLIIPELDLGYGIPVWMEYEYRYHGKRKRVMILDEISSAEPQQIEAEMEKILAEIFN